MYIHVVQVISNIPYSSTVDNRNPDFIDISRLYVYPPSGGSVTSYPDKLLLLTVYLKRTERRVIKSDYHPGPCPGTVYGDYYLSRVEEIRAFCVFSQLNYKHVVYHPPLCLYAHISATILESVKISQIDVKIKNSRSSYRRFY